MFFQSCLESGHIKLSVGRVDYNVTFSAFDPLGIWVGCLSSRVREEEPFRIKPLRLPQGFVRSLLRVRSPAYTATFLTFSPIRLRYRTTRSANPTQLEDTVNERVMFF